MNFSLKIGSAEFKFGREKTLSPDLSAFVTAQDVDANGVGATLTSAYSQSSWVYIAISILAENVSKIPFRISRLSSAKARRVRALRDSADPAHRTFCRRSLSETIVETGPVVDLFNRPHPSMNRQLFWETVVTWNAMRGEFMIVPLDNEDQPVDLSARAPKIAKMLCLTPDLFWHIVVGYELEGWRYTGSPLLTPLPSEILLPSEVVHSRSPNPYLYWRGMSPLIVAFLPAQTDFAGAQFQKGLWINNADTGVIVRTDQQATTEQRAAILTALRERKRKAGTADRPLFLWGGAQVEKPMLSMMDMQYLETRKALREEIASIFKVPQAMMGFNDAKAGSLSGGGAAIDAERMTFTESVLGTLCMRLEAACDPIIKTFGDDLLGWFDIDSLPIMQAARRARVATAVSAFGIGATFNDANKLYDLGFPEYPWGDKSYLPFGLQEVTDGVEPPMPSEDDPEKKPGDEDDDDNDEDGDGEKSNPFLRMKRLLAGIQQPEAPAMVRKPKVKELWESHMRARKANVNLFESKTRKVLNQFRGKTLAKLAEVHLADKSIEKRSLIDIIFSATQFGQALDGALQNPIQSLLQSAGLELLGEIGSDDPWTMAPAAVKQYIASRTQKILGVGGTVRDQLNTTLEEGIENGETHDQLAARVKATFNSLMSGHSDGEEGMTTSEARRVAQTEVNAAYGFSRHQTMIDVGISYKSWLSSHGPHVRAAHAEAEERYIDNPIPVGDPFIVAGEELMYPGDSAGSAGNVINCQCIQLAAEKSDEDEKSVTYKIFGYGQINFSKS